MKTKAPPTLGDLLRAARDAAGLTRLALSRTLDCDPQTIYTWERGTKQPSPAMVRRLAAALGCEPDPWLVLLR